MDLGERVRELSYLIPAGVAERMNRKWISKIPLEGFIGNLIPNNLKIKYISKSYDLGEMQKRSELWQPISAGFSICIAGLFGFNFSRLSPFTKVVGGLGTLATNISNVFFIVGIPYRLSSHHDQGRLIRSIPLINNFDKFFRFIGDYNEKPFPASMTIELAYKWIIEQCLGEEKFFSFLDSASNYAHSLQSHVKDFYWVRLPKYAHSFTV